jgi:glycosyltransferase involved in cell wall biosynthesis
MKLHYAGAPGEGWGWGVCSANLIRELAKLVTLTGANEADAVFMPLGGSNLEPHTAARARLNLAYTFFEAPLGPRAKANAARYDVVFGGSTWCLERLRECATGGGQLLIQGVDQAIFRPAPRRADGSFRVFSGGKFEWRKGQDLVIAAFAQFARRHPESGAHLLGAWFNAWPHLIRGMARSPHLAFDGVTGDERDQARLFASLLARNGLESSQFTILPQLAQPALAAEMANTDCGLFPNRCEGGTNLVLMEYLACGRPAVANLLTGHADLAGADIVPIPATEDARHWAEQRLEDVVQALEAAYARHLAGTPAKPQAAELPRTWTWERAARTVVAPVGEVDPPR